MVSATFAVVVITVFALAFASLRWVGILGVAFLIYLFPLVTVSLLILAAVVFYVVKPK